MKDNSSYVKGLFTGLGTAALVIIFAVFAWKLLYPIPYQNPPRAVQPASTPADIGELTTRVENLENDQVYNLKNLEWQIDQKILVLGWTALAISVIAGFLGVRTYNELGKVIKEKIRTTLENELYQLDPVNLTVRLPKHHPDKEKIQVRLQAAGLKNIKEYTELSDKCKVGLTVVPIENADQEKDYVNFLDNEKPDPDDAAFVLYSDPRKHPVSPDVINKHVRAATANMPSTVVTAILAISRGLHRDRAIQSAKEDM